MNRFSLLGTSHITTPATLAAGQMARRPLQTSTAARHRGRELSLSAPVIKTEIA